ncbi:MAG: glycerophosphodiester phosphodiesterase family protein, partial [Candidatus Saccharimonadales bacterium]
MKQANTPVIVGHRGAHGAVPGNTLASFEKAIACGATEIETDSRLTSDGVVVQLHDAFFLDKAGIKHEIADTTFEVLKRHVPDVMTLQELINFVDQRARLMLEIKRGVPTEPII